MFIKNKFISKFIIGSCLVYLSITASASPLASSPSVIPLDNLRTEATDLYYKSKHLLPNEVSALRDQGYDISLLNPDTTTDLWRPRGFAKTNDDVALGVNEGATVTYYSRGYSPLNTFRFYVQHKDKDGQERAYDVFLGKRLQTYLLRRNLLRKLGFYIPPMKRLKRLDVQFRTSLEKNNFVEDKRNGLQVQAQGDKEWILNLNDKDSSLLQMQDVVVMPQEVKVVNLAFGQVNADGSDLVQGRRLINSLIVPFNLVDVQESINGFRWHSVLVRSKSLYLPLEETEQFSATLADARWIMRAITTLTRSDWDQITSGIGYPEAARLLLVEKLISRRNELARQLKLDAQPLDYNPMISYGAELVNGELQRGEWEGLAARLSMGEDPSVVSGEEIRSLFKSQLITSAIDSLILQVNKDILPRTDLTAAAFEANKNRVIKDITNFINTGKDTSSNLGIWTKPFYNANLIAGRQVIAGNYLGADNRIQLVDTFGVSLDTGMYFGTTGLKMGQSLDARTRVYYYRQYAHLKPLQSIETALKQPYKNMLVPLLKKEWAQLIDPKAFELKNGESELDLEERLKSMVTSLKNNLGEGESLIVSDGLGAGANLRAGYQIAKDIHLQAQIDANRTFLSRLHILRVGDNLHVYRDRGNLKALQFIISLRAKVEVLSVQAKLSSGTAKTEFFRLNLKDDLKENPDLPLVLKSLREIFLNNKTRNLRLFEEPTTLEHELSESQSNINFLFWNRFSLKTQDRVSLLRANDPEPENFLRRLTGSRSGENYQTIAVDVLNEILTEVIGNDFSITDTSIDDPADTLYGKSKARYSVFEAEIGSDNKFSESFVSVNYRWRGWSSSKGNLEKIVKEFSDRYNFEFFHPQTFQQIKRADLYTMNLRIFVYDRGIKRLVTLTEGELATLLKDYISRNYGKDTHSIKVLDRFIRLQRHYNIQFKKGNLNKQADLITKMVSLLETSLNYKGLIKAVGGDKNILIQPILTGFMRGEDGNFSQLPIEGHQIGQYGSARRFGPLSTTQIELGMTESEFFAYWLIRRI